MGAMNNKSVTLPIPAVILGGRDRKPAELPQAGQDKHALSAYKGAAIQIGGHPIILAIIERLKQSGCFDPIFVAGPASVYHFAKDKAQIVDTDGQLDENVGAALEQVQLGCGRTPLALFACDVLPEVANLQALMRDYLGHQPNEIFFPLVRVPDIPTLGESAWKPKYQVIPQGGTKPVTVLPGHLLVIDPPTLRLRLIFTLTRLAYHTRNKGISHRRSVMIRGALGYLLKEDLKSLLKFQIPHLTFTVIINAIRGARELQGGNIQQEILERRLRKILVRARHRVRHHDHGVYLPVVDALELAKDVDTVEEADELQARFAQNTGQR
jgi:hypothetical protein